MEKNLGKGVRIYELHDLIKKIYQKRIRPTLNVCLFIFNFFNFFVSKYAATTPTKNIFYGFTVDQPFFQCCYSAYWLKKCPKMT